MRDIPVGNGSLLVNFDDKYQIRDIYFPHVGQENHTEGFPFRFGVWVDGTFSWIYSDDWTRQLNYLPDTLVTDVTLSNTALGIEIVCHDTVAGLENIYLRRINVRDTSGMAREVRVFLHQDFRLYENKVGDTAFYDPDTRSLIHYKKHRYFLINTSPHFSEVATGRKAFRQSEGTWRDAEDGRLHGGPITEGSVDSTIGVHFRLEARGTFEFFYWIAAGTSKAEVASLNSHVLTREPQNHFRESETFWRVWVCQPRPGLLKLSPKIGNLYERSLLVIRTQIDNGGAIIAANDHDVTDRATDHYSYLWPRDGAFVANALDIAGHPELARKFFEICHRIVDERGYFLQKYNPDGSVGSGWHSFWDAGRELPVVPIQEDETALVIWALWEHFQKCRDIDLVNNLYSGLILRCADFMVAHRDPQTNLPLPSWNLWEDRRGVHTFTCATIVAGLRAAANFARLFEDLPQAEIYTKAADEMCVAMSVFLYSEEHGRFLRGLLSNNDDSFTPDPIVDASLFGIFYFGCFAADDPMVVSTMTAVAEKLANTGDFGGIARFEYDSYMSAPEPAPSNSWIITTLWLAEYFIASARSIEDLQKAQALLEWTADRALPSGILAEQIDPRTGEPRSVSPLTWSHSTFITTVDSYLSKLKHLETG